MLTRRAGAQAAAASCNALLQRVPTLLQLGGNRSPTRRYSSGPRAHPAGMLADVSTFRGAIAGVGTTSGVRVVVGRWDLSPYGAFADAMVETRGPVIACCWRRRGEVADFVAATYVFDEVRLEPVTVDGWRFTSTC